MYAKEVFKIIVKDKSGFRIMVKNKLFIK